MRSFYLVKERLKPVSTNGTEKGELCSSGFQVLNMQTDRQQQSRVFWHERDGGDFLKNKSRSVHCFKTDTMNICTVPKQKTLRYIRGYYSVFLLFLKRYSPLWALGLPTQFSSLPDSLWPLPACSTSSLHLLRELRSSL
jgi:hypothetical protein